MTGGKHSHPLNSRKALFLFLVLLMAGNPCRASIVDGVAARVNDQIITISDVKQRVHEVAKAKGITSSVKIKKIQGSILDKMIEEKLFLTKAGELKIRVEDKDVDLAIEDIRKKNNFTKDQFAGMLKTNGLTLDRYREEMRDQIIISKVAGMLVRSEVKVTEREIKDYFSKHKDKFTTPEEVKASHILITFKKGVPKEQVKKKAYDIYRKLKKGGNFASLARLYSEDATAADGGNLGFFKRGVMVSGFEKAAFSLKVGETGKPIRTKFGYHIIRVTDRKAPNPIPLEKARPSIARQLKQRKYQEKYKEALRELREKNYVEILWGQISPRPGHGRGPTTKSSLERRSEIKTPDIGEEIKRILLKWKRAVEKRDIATYASFYSADFRSNHQDKKKWVEQQKKFYRAHHRIRCTIRDLRVRKKGPLYVATFGQEFFSDKERFLVKRRLYLSLKDGEMKILGEKWVRQKPDFKKFSRKPRLTFRTKVRILGSSS